MKRDREMNDDGTDTILEREFELAHQETQNILQHWGGRGANPLIVTPVMVSALFTLIRSEFGKDQYDVVVRGILAAVEQELEENKGDGHDSRRHLH